MQNQYRAIKISKTDNVAVAIINIPKGAKVLVSNDKELITKEDIPLGHKLALIDIAEGGDIVRYGEAICQASNKIKLGSWVHIHNTISRYSQ